MGNYSKRQKETPFEERIILKTSELQEMIEEIGGFVKGLKGQKPLNK